MYANGRKRVMAAMPARRRHLSEKLWAFHVKKPTWFNALNSSRETSTRQYTTPPFPDAMAGVAFKLVLDSDIGAWARPVPQAHSGSRKLRQSAFRSNRLA